MSWYLRRDSFRFQLRDVERYKTYLTKKKLSEASVSTYLTALRRLCRFLVSHKVLATNPVDQVGGNRRPRSHASAVLTPAQVSKLLATLRGSTETGLRETAIIRVMLECGLSEIELVRANIGDYVPSAPTLTVQRKGMHSKDDVVRLTAGAAASIDRYLEWRTSAGEVLSSERPLLLSAGNRTRGRRMSTRGIRQVVHGYLSEAGILGSGAGKITPRSLRVTAARRMADAGATLEEIRRNMGVETKTAAAMYVAEHRNG